MKTLYVVDSTLMHDALEKDLKLGCKVVMIGDNVLGFSFEDIVLLTDISTDSEKRWFEYLKTTLVIADNTAAHDSSLKVMHSKV